MKKTRDFIFALFLFVLPVGNGSASGVPVVDVVSNIQLIQGYIQQLADYKQLISQTTGIDNQYLQMIVDYKQKMNEYVHYLQQLQSIKASFSTHDWNQIFQSVATAYGTYNPALVALLDPSAPGYANSVRTILSQYDLAPDTKAATLATYTGMGAHHWGTGKTKQLEADLDQLNLDYERYANQQEVVSASAKELAKLKISGDKIKAKAASLGDDDTLKTQQLILSQQSTLIGQQQVMANIANAQLQNYESFSAFQNRSKTKYYKDEAARLGTVVGQPFSLSGVSNFASTGL
jgi:hypothetical protein